MKSLLTALTILVFGGSLALAQCSTPTATNTGMSSVSAVSMGEVVSTDSPYAVSAICPCAAIATDTIGGDHVIMVLGSEEYYALNNLHLRNLNWREVSSNYATFNDPDNPLTSFSPNGVVRHHGNPYYPYYQVGWYHPGVTNIAMTSSVAGSTECYAAALPTTVTTTDQTTLRAVTDQYRGLTPQQAQVLGYQPLCACVTGLGQVYINPSLVGTSIDPAKPQAFVFSSDGHLLAVQYVVNCSQSVSLFGQPLLASDEVSGGQQLTAWLWSSNSNGLFAMRNPGVGCGPSTAANCGCGPTVAGTSQRYMNRRCMNARL